MTNSRPPQENRPHPSANPFDNAELNPSSHPCGNEHVSDHPGRDYEERGATRTDGHGEGGRTRHRHSGPNSPSEPRRPGTGERQGPRRSGAEHLTSAEPVVPGEVLLQNEPVVINAGRPVTSLRVTNTGDRPIQVGSHYHFAEVNSALDFDRSQAWGKRLNVLSGGAVRFEPGDVEDVQLVPFGGDRIALGFRGECRGPLDD